MSLQQRFKKPEALHTTQERMLTPKRSVVYVGLSIDTIYDMIKTRAIPYVVRPGTGKKPKYLIDKMDWDRWIERRKIPAIA